LLSISPLSTQEYMSVSPRRSLPYWQDVNVVQVNKEYPRTSLRDFRVKSTLDENYRDGIFEP